MAGWFVAIGCVVAQLVLAGCSPAPRAEATDAGMAAPRCGNGILEAENTAFPHTPEQCDDGPLNGTSTSLCTKQCRSEAMWLHAPRVLQLGSEADRLVAIDYDDVNDWGVAFSALGESAVHIVHQVSESNYGGPPLNSRSCRSRRP